MEARRALEQAARDSYGRLVAYLSVHMRDVAAAEDALGDAFRAALETWPLTGVPEKPEAWLLTAARRRLIDGGRQARVRDEAVTTLLAVAEEATQLLSSDAMFPDERLKLLFICAHPAIDTAARTPLMLQTVLGLDAARIASAFLVQPDAMGRRLTRAKAKIRDAGIAFEIPEAKELQARLDAVLEAIYAAYGSGWDDVAGADPRRKGLAAEAIDLGRLLLRFMPAEPEVQGLVALMLHCEARREARRSETGAYVPLSNQDPVRWSQPMIEEAEQLLLAAHEANRIGRFQLEAAIQSVHARRAVTGDTDWEALALLYEGLTRFAPTLGALVGRAAAVAEARNAEAGWALLEAIPEGAVDHYQSYWALAAHLLARLQRVEEALSAYSRAIGLCEDPAIREFLAQRAARLLN
ncbi:RNA polymerase sigma-70 factor, ECF subfamily [Rhizobiales bacterium GAS191]|jgi:predicted RNA polymerase sigma factor|nr:RNA polymerase sigma-70 factor, ECF subfamily [Rhizobiales bacterium GAS191]SEE73689.1 RNA polymerase sigma-70 factor, ECF subfamily [Rhizobiales bacterium GAS188]